MVQETMTKAYEDAGVIVHKGHNGFAKMDRLEDAPASVADGAVHEKRTEGPSLHKQLRITDHEGQSFECNELLWAIGRAPEIADLHLNVPGLQLTKSGHISVDDLQNTSVDGIYALGDVTGRAELTPGMLFSSTCISQIRQIDSPPQWQ